MLFSIFLFGTMIPVHAYAHAADCPPMEEQQWTAGAESQSDTQSSNCDHCCHASVHSLGIHKITPSIQFTIKTIGPFSTDLTYHSLITAPPYHPPILS